ncbi:thioredoxin family protein [Acinetobacter rudis]|uniref:thioredoxin family protein n=1 Tax=Acinetobacter rudis TaxID=632955 RepID=UPI003342AAF0
MNILTEYNENNFQDFEHHSGLAVIRFYAHWCTPCVQSKPTFIRLAQQSSNNIKFGQVNIDQSPILTQRYQVYGLPSILFFDHGQIVKRMTGLLTLQQYIQTLEQLELRAGIDANLNDHQA